MPKVVLDGWTHSIGLKNSTYLTMADTLMKKDYHDNVRIIHPQSQLNEGTEGIGQQEA